MNKAVETRLNKSRPGGWIPRDGAHIERWIRRIKHYVTSSRGRWCPPSPSCGTWSMPTLRCMPRLTPCSRKPGATST